MQGARIGRLTGSGKPAFVADTQGVAVMIPAMSSDTFVRSSAVNFTVTCHVEVIADIIEATVPDVVPPTIVKAQAHALRRG